jgi:choice-of-anchor A domain-containing protein
MPDGATSDYGINSVAEGVFVGGTATASSPSDALYGRVSGTCSTPGCLATDFSNAQSYYSQLSSQVAAVTPNTAIHVDDSHALNIVCNDPAAAVNYITLDTSTFNSLLSYNTPVGCGANSAYVFNVQPNVDGSSSVTVQGNGQQFTDASNVVYNFPASGNKRVASALRQVSTPNGGLMGSTLAPHCNLDAGTGVNTGITIAGNIANSNQFNKPNCPTPVTPPTNPNGDNLCPYFESDCAGLQFPLGNTIGSFRDFNVVCFGDFNANTGDVEGRIAVQNNLNLGAGYSVGYQLQTANGQDAALPYSVVVGGNAVFISGAVYPEGNGIPYPGAEEDLFVGGTFTGESDLADRVLGSCHGVAGCLNTYFDASKQCYINYQTSLSSNADNAAVSISWDAIIFTCDVNNADTYYITIDASVLTQGTYYILNNCAFQAKWVINIGGNGPVVFAGDNLPGTGSSNLYNILGSGRTIYVETEVNGNILAPQNVLNQTGGVVEGKVVVGNAVASLQVNKPACSEASASSINAQSNVVVPKGSSHIAVNGNGGIQKGDSVSFGNQQFTVVSSSDSDIQVDSATNNDNAAGSKISAQVANPSASRVPVTAGSSSQPAPSAAASTLQACVALIVAVALLF